MRRRECAKQGCPAGETMLTLLPENPHDSRRGTPRGWQASRARAISAPTNARDISCTSDGFRTGMACSADSVPVR